MANPASGSERHLTQLDLRDLLAKAETLGLVGTARKTQLVDARPAAPGEVVVTVIAGEGEETRSRPAREGDWVVRSRCEATGHEEYLVPARDFARGYEPTGATEAPGGWRECRPIGRAVRFVRLGPQHGSFTFTAPWGERTVARPGDAIVEDPDDPDEKYRVAAAAFACSYEILD